MERFQPVIGTGDADVGERRDRCASGSPTSTRRASPGVSILVGGEEAGGKLTYGCRMGICHTCVGRLAVWETA